MRGLQTDTTKKHCVSHIWAIMSRYVLWLSLLTTGLLFSGTSGLQFNDDTYLYTVWETQADDAVGAALDSNPPTPTPEVIRPPVCVEDDRSPVNNTTDLRYSIVEGNTTLFSIDNETGQFSVADVPFDYEEQSWYLVKLSCFLTSDPSKNGTAAVNITIGSLNEYLPEYGDSTDFINSITIKETTLVGTLIASVDGSIGPLRVYPTATDRDRGPDGRVQYILTNTDSRIDQFLELDPTSGTLTLKAQLDIDDHTDTFERLDFHITACNENVVIGACPIIGLTIFVIAANEHHPVFVKQLYTASVLESAMNDTHVIEVQCEDEDNGEGSVQSISFQGNTSSLVLSAFELISGNLSLLTELDYENTTKYEMTLVCSDGDNIGTTQVVVNVLPVNDNVPQFTLDVIELTAHRTDPPDTIIGQVEATDADTGGVGDTVTYSIDSSPYFDINSETGEITLKQYLDNRDGHTFDFDVVASDGEYEARKHVRVTTTGLLSVPEWIYVGVGGAAVLVIFVVVGVIVFYCFIKAARIRIVEKYREQEINSDSELVDMGSIYPHPPMFPIPPPMFPPDAGMSMVGQPLYPGMEEDEDSETSSILATLESSHNPLTPGPVLKEVVDYFHEGDKVLDKKGSKK